MNFLKKSVLIPFFASLTFSLSGEPLWIAGEGGVYRVELDDSTGAMSAPHLACAFGSGSFLAIHPELDIIYSSYREKGSTGYASLKANGQDNKLEVQSVQIVSSVPAHVAVSSNGKLLAGAHWGGRSNFVFELETDGSISDRLIQLEQAGEGPGRSQGQSRPHWATFAGNDSLLHSVDLGSDEVWTYHVGEGVGSISLSHKVKLPLGTGPRHMSLNEKTGYAYVNGEVNLAVNTFFYDSATGRFSPLQYIPTVDAPAEEGLTTLSEIRQHENGRFLYAAVRGLDLVVVYAVDPDTGLLTLVERQDALVDWPRNFTISQSGKWLIVAGQHSGDLQVFSINQDSGVLEAVDSRIEIKNPVCVRAWGRM